MPTNVVADISVLPRSADVPSLGTFVEVAVKVIQSSGLKYEVDAMSTAVEGEFEEVMDLFKRVHRAVMDAGADRLVTIIRIDEKRGGVTIDGKLEGFR
ncbi:MAG: MTH1187 family thiamine-binding protein [Chloroflexi bacterium]|nr:MTH1187 family thiamine-binding protein [Chloroflexota bacterium]